MCAAHKTTLLDYIGLKTQREVDNIDTLQINTFLKRFENHNGFFGNCLPLIFLLDFTTGQYKITSHSLKNILGYDAREMLEGGIHFSLNIYHEEDKKTFNEEAFPERLSFLQSVPKDEHPLYIFSNNLRLRNKRKEYVSVLQKSSIIQSDKEGNPMLSLGMLININDFKRDTSIVQTIEKCEVADNNLFYKKISHSIFFPHHEDKILSKREKEFLKWMAEGLSSKMLADKFHVSEHTVANHRKKMLYKTNTKNIAQLVGWAFKNGII